LGEQSGIVAGTLSPHPTPLSVEGYRYFDDADDDPEFPAAVPIATSSPK